MHWCSEQVSHHLPSHPPPPTQLAVLIQQVNLGQHIDVGQLQVQHGAEGQHEAADVPAAAGQVEKCVGLWFCVFYEGRKNGSTLTD